MSHSKIVYSVTAAAYVVLASGCMSMQGTSTIDALQGALSSKEPVVEAYVEYPGVNERWAGPRSFVVHVTAKDAGEAKIEVLPTMPDTQRTVASETSKVSETVGVPAEVARGNFTQLQAALSEENIDYIGCLSPVRVRLVRTNGALTEKQGCRGYGRWTQTASEFVNFFLTAQQYGFAKKTIAQTETPVLPALDGQRQPASVTTDRVPTGEEVFTK